VRNLFASQPSLISVDPPVKIFGDVHGQVRPSGLQGNTARGGGGGRGLAAGRASEWAVPYPTRSLQMDSLLKFFEMSGNPVSDISNYVFLGRSLRYGGSPSAYLLTIRCACLASFM